MRDPETMHSDYATHAAMCMMWGDFRRASAWFISAWHGCQHAMADDPAAYFSARDRYHRAYMLCMEAAR